MPSPYAKKLKYPVYERNLVRVAVAGLSDEATIYGVFTEFVMYHNPQSQRFILSPQLNLKWNPDDEVDGQIVHNNDQRAEIPDFGIGHFTLPGLNPPFKLRCGVEAKRATEEMALLPAPDSLINNPKVIWAFHSLYYQAMDQAKAAYKNNYPLRADARDGVYWILLVGPYWTVEKFGPFTRGELGVRAKKKSDSGDYEETTKLWNEMAKTRQLSKLYILNSDESSRRLEEIFNSTHQVAQPYINAMTQGKQLNLLGRLINTDIVFKHRMTWCLSRNSVDLIVAQLYILVVAAHRT